jgi:hypothetical protein
MASDHPSFHHQPLNHEAREFRLLKLLPYSSFEDDVYCEVFHSSLDNHPPYEALSYVWGNPSNLSEIRCNKAPCLVTKNLAAALRYLRRKDGERTMWVDALCINQRDYIEKTHQVRQMRGVYTGAEQVRVWLGEEHELEMQQNLPSTIDRRSFKVRRRDLASPSSEQVVSMCCYDLFLARSWWTRTWILQEVIHDRPVIACVEFLDFDFDLMCGMSTWYYLSEHFPPTPDHRQATEAQLEVILPPHPRAKCSGLSAAAAALKMGSSIIQFARCGMKQDPPGHEPLIWFLQCTRAQKCSDPSKCWGRAYFLFQTVS